MRISSLSLEIRVKSQQRKKRKEKKKELRWLEPRESATCVARFL